MIVSRRRQGLLLVRQVDHQDQCALMADAWGNAGFARPEPFAPIAMAAARHDEGWRGWEGAPRVAGGAPVNFTQIDRATHVALYRAAIGAAVEADPRAGLLTSLHGQGLYEGRGGLDPGPPPRRADRPVVVRDFLIAQDALQDDLRRRIGAGSDLDAWASAGYRLIQTWDALSLHLTWTGAAAGRTIVLPQVPREVGDPGLELTVRPAGALSCIVSPWPFSGDAVEVPVAARVIEDRPYASDLDLHGALAQAPWITLGLRVRSE